MIKYDHLKFKYNIIIIKYLHYNEMSYKQFFYKILTFLQYITCKNYIIFLQRCIPMN